MPRESKWTLAELAFRIASARFRAALHYCVEHSSPTCIRLLIHFGGANPNATDSSLLTPLHYCVIHNCEESLQELLDAHNIQVHLADQNQRSPLHYAAASGNVTILSALADVSRENLLQNVSLSLGSLCLKYDYKQLGDIDGLSPLHYAVLRGKQ